MSARGRVSDGMRLAVPGTISYLTPPLEQAPMVYVLIVYSPEQKVSHFKYVSFDSVVPVKTCNEKSRDTSNVNHIRRRDMQSHS